MKGSLTVEDLKAKTVAVTAPLSSGTSRSVEHTHDWGGVASSDHSVQRRVCKACWAQSGTHSHAGTESSLTSAAMQLAKAFESQVCVHHLCALVQAADNIWRAGPCEHVIT
jgi:hypothetical protein